MRRWIVLILSILVVTAAEGPVTVHAASQQKIVNMGTWKHPVKEAFKAAGVTLKQVELYQNGTYPKFYVELPFKLQDSSEREVMDLVSAVARANGYWSYELIDSRQAATIKVLSDPKKKVIGTVTVNGNAHFFDQRFDKYLSGITSLAELNVQASGDIDNDSKTEYVVYTHLEPEDTAEKVELHVIRQNGKRFENLGKLEDAVIVVHGLDHVEILKLDQSGKKHIAVYMEGILGGEGFNLYQWTNNRPVLLESNFPNATGQGKRYLEDIDANGIMDSVSEYSYEDLQGHQLFIYHPYDGSASDQYKVLYHNGHGQFTYPDSAESVIRNYIEDSLWPEANFAEMKRMAADPEILKFKVSKVMEIGLLEYGELDLTYTTLSNKNGVKIIKVTQNSGDYSRSLKFTMVSSSGQWKIKRIE
ncbi:hypothetical protein [Paenibacillus typhae]|uniref:Uncharacterized protein n=1 Tax=Paenibacillus typhae TaxID=1174501 RepID=A0A1G8J387_9BACL|nr:hypothetical protein [Paenibacillus typhae]SDI25130.1 hypothetical protein SAMN05216192_10445 [Paenibacillus typhae]